MRTYLFCLSLLFLCACHSTRKIQKDDALKTLQTLMTGSFDSSTQAKQDSNYFNISLHMYPIWKNKAGTWLYVEQAVSANQAKPYRQRIYKLEQLEKNSFVSKVFTLEEPEKFIGKWKTPNFFNDLETSILKEREGCGVYLEKKGNVYSGSTNADNCKSTLRGASYATSKVTISNGKVESWDQGFNDAGEQVWGATEGAYVFLKQ